MFKLLSGLIDLISTLLTLFNNRKIGEAAVNKVELSADEKEISRMRNDKDFADSLINNPALIDRVRESTNPK